MKGDAEVFGPYRLDELLGRGGMGEVYRAYDLEFERTVAVKRLAGHLADDPRFQERFRREAHHVARLSNPHIVPIHRYGEIGGQLYIDMRYVEGGDLSDRLVAGPLPPDRAVRILEQLASALDDAHVNGLVHRDVKPSNALLDGRVADFCYLADFGITRLATDRRSNSLTRTGALLGSLAYMAPEQFDGVVTQQSDIYSLTCVFYEMLTGARPYAGDGLPVLMHAHMRVAAPRPSERNPAVAAFDEVVATGMAKVATDRFASAGALAAAARAALEGRTVRSPVDDEPTRPERDLPTVARTTAAGTTAAGTGAGAAGTGAAGTGAAGTGAAGTGAAGTGAAGTGAAGTGAAGTTADRAQVSADRWASPVSEHGESYDSTRRVGVSDTGIGDLPHGSSARQGPGYGTAHPSNADEEARGGAAAFGDAEAIDGGAGHGAWPANGDAGRGAANGDGGAGRSGSGGTPATGDQETDVDARVGGPTENLRTIRPGLGRRWIPPLAVAAVILALVGATWAIAQSSATVAGTPRAAPASAQASAAPGSAAPSSAAVGPGAAPPAGPVLTEAVFTGRTSDNGITLAIGIKDGRAAGYLCDGSKVEAWLEGGISGEKVTLHGRDPSTVLDATASERGLLGTITVAGVGRPFAAALATGPAGLYQSKRALNGITTRIGWIVLPDGTQVGIRNENGIRTPAPTLDAGTAEAVDSGATVRAERVSGATVVLG